MRESAGERVRVSTRRERGFPVTAAIDESSGTVDVVNDNDATVSLLGVRR